MARNDDGSFEVHFTPISEDIYFSPGANRREEGDRVAYDVVRAGISERPDVSHPASYAEAAAMVMRVPDDGLPVYLGFADGETPVPLR
jgi:hypothetical protein